MQVYMLDADLFYELRLMEILDCLFCLIFTGIVTGL